MLHRLLLALLIVCSASAQDDRVLFCSDLESGHALRECKAHIKGAPPVFIASLAQDISIGVLQAFYRKACPDGGCMIDFRPMDRRLRSVNQAELLASITRSLREKCKVIAFSGTSSDEILVTTKSETGNDSLSYYQVLLVARSCSKDSDGSHSCEILGGASKLTTSNGRRQTDTDETCQAIEQDILDRLTKLVVN
jgi:hypothetical protein